MTAPLYLSVIVPAYNEERRIAETLRRLQEYLSGKSFSYEILVVLDGPTDRTRDVIQAMESEIRQLRILHRVVNRGKGYAVREGMLQASGQIRLFTDADNSTDISHFDKMKPLFDQGCDIVIASRHSGDAAGARQAVPQAWYKRLLGSFGNLWIQSLAVKGIWDTQCGFKAFRAAAAEKIFSRAVIDGWGFDVEALALARAWNCRIGAVPAYWVDKPHSHVGLLSYFQVLLETLKVRYALASGRYRA